jgi:hypothetical protein
VNSSKELTAMLLARVESLAEYLFPKGHKEGASWRVGSLDINLRTGMWGDWDGSTQRMSRNLVNLWIYASQTDFKTAISEIQTWLGVPDTAFKNGIAKSDREAEPRQAEEAKKLRLPLLDKPNRDELLELSLGRSIALEPLTIAVGRGFLWTYHDRKEGARGWLLCDRARKMAIVRRLDGLPWKSISAKSKTLFGSTGSWPLGILEAENFPAIGLAEGAPDFLSIIAHAWASGLEDRVAPVCMAGAGMNIPQDVLPRFVGKRVRIFIDNDNEGNQAALRWCDQLTLAGASVDGFSFDELVRSDGEPVKDLNDLCQIDCDCWESNRQTVESIMDFSLERSP